jgi:hypothetical protein
MSALALVRPVVLAGACLLLAACEAPQNDGHMFQRWAESVQAIPVSDTPPKEGQASAAPAAQAVTAPAPQKFDPMTIAVVDRIDMPNAREAGLRSALKLVHAAVKQQVAETPPTPARVAAVTPAVAHTAPALVKTSDRLVQLAAFTTEADARTAWRRLNAVDPAAFRGLSPRFERADLGAKGVWIRLKVGLPSAAADARRVCAAAGLAAARCA